MGRIAEKGTTRVEGAGLKVQSQNGEGRHRWRAEAATFPYQQDTDRLISCGRGIQENKILRKSGKRSDSGVPRG